MSRPLAYIALLLTLLVGLAPLDAMAGDNPRIAVLELQGELPTSSLMLLSDKVRAGVLDAIQGRNIVVMSRENMAVLAKDMGLDLSCIEGACEVETGRNIGAAYVVSGGITQMGGIWLCTVKIHQTQSGALLATGDTEAESPLSLRNEIPPLVARLVSKAFGGGGPKAKVQLGGEEMDFAQLARDARQDGGGGGQTGDVGRAQVDLGGDPGLQCPGGPGEGQGG
jgi:TolB-like protein